MAKTNMTEDKVALILGGFIFLLAILNMAHEDVLGWVVSTNMLSLIHISEPTRH